MTLTLDLTADLEQRLIDEASRHGVPPDQFVVEVLKQHLPVRDRDEQFALGYPAGYFETTAGSFANEPLETPPQLPIEIRETW